VHDAAREAGVRQIEVANVAHEAWRWRHTRRKTDRVDAVRLADLSAAGQLPTVHVPQAATRQWRGLIAYRARLVARRTAVKNRIRAILASVGEPGLPRGAGGWTRQAVASLAALARPLAEVGSEDLWRGELALELEALAHLEAQVATVEAKLDTLAEAARPRGLSSPRADERVARLRTIPGVGPRLAELLVALFDDPHRFGSGRQVGSYLGLVPRQFQSGAMDRHGRITRHGNPLARALLVEVAWLGLRWNGRPRVAARRVRAIYQRVHRGSRARRKVAIVAVARRLAVFAWAMLRDGTVWRPERPEEKPTQPRRAGAEAGVLA
jgi:transposase